MSENLLTVFVDGHSVMEDGPPEFARQIFVASVAAGRPATLYTSKGQVLASCPTVSAAIEARLDTIEHRLDSIVVDGEGRLHVTHVEKGRTA